MKRSLLLVGALGGAVASGCGDPIADGSYRGEPLARLQGRIEGDAGTSSIAHPFLGIVWFNITSEVAEAVTVLEPMQGGLLSRDFSVDVWDPPPRSAIGDFYGSRVALGVAVAVDDVNGDGKVEIDPNFGTIAPPDLAFGGGIQNWLVYVEGRSRDLCEPWLFGGPVDTGTLYVSDGFAHCSSIFSVLPKGAPMTIDLFPPTSTLPDGEEAVGGCQDEVPCEEDPDQPACAVVALSEACMQSRCFPLLTELDRCEAEFCQTNPDDDCLLTHCAAPMNAVNVCMNDTCSFETLCSN